MNQQEALRRLEALEAKARVAECEQLRHDPWFRAEVAEHAARFGLDVDEMIEESMWVIRHIAEVGEAAWRAECEAEHRERAERMGMSFERYQEIDWDAEYAEWVAQGSIPGAWRGRDWNNEPTRPAAPSW